MAKSVFIETDECIGCENCVELCPDIFEFDDEAGVAVVVRPEGGDENCIQEAIDNCPAECIHWNEE